MKKMTGIKTIHETAPSSPFEGRIEGKILQSVLQSQNIHQFKDEEKLKKDIAEAIKERTSYTVISSQQENVSSTLEDREKLENQSIAQDIFLKRNTLIVLFIFLAIETVAIFAFAYFQAVRFQKFHLDEWSFRLLIAATITQITFMVRLTVRHLFPEKK